MTSTTNTSTSTTDYPHTDPADCQPWCNGRTGGGHLAFRAGGERECSTDFVDLTLTLGDKVDFGEGDMRPDYLGTYLWCTNAEGVTVNLSHHDDSGPRMTPAEARQLADDLIRLADLAEAAGR